MENAIVSGLLLCESVLALVGIELVFFAVASMEQYFFTKYLCTCAEHKYCHAGEEAEGGDTTRTVDPS